MKITKYALWLLVLLSFTITAKTTSAEEKPSIDKQIRVLSKEIKTFENIIKDIENIIDLYQQEKMGLIEKRAQLNALREILITSEKDISKSSKKIRLMAVSPEREAAESAAIVIGAGVVGGPVAAGIAGAIEVNRKLDKALQEVEKQNEKIKEQLNKQKEDICKEQGLYCD